MLKCSLCDYGDAYILVKERITITGLELMLHQDKQMKKIKVQYLKIVLHLLNAQVK